MVSVSSEIYFSRAIHILQPVSVVMWFIVQGNFQAEVVHLWKIGGNGTGKSGIFVCTVPAAFSIPFTRRAPHSFAHAH